MGRPDAMETDPFDPMGGMRFGPGGPFRFPGGGGGQITADGRPVLNFSGTIKKKHKPATTG